MLDHYNLEEALEESHVLMIVSDLQAGLKETSGEIKLFVNQNMSPGKREYTDHPSLQCVRVLSIRITLKNITMKLCDLIIT